VTPSQKRAAKIRLVRKPCGCLACSATGRLARFCLEHLPQMYATWVEVPVELRIAADTFLTRERARVE
jgi:hypothetical protein